MINTKTGKPMIKAKTNMTFVEGGISEPVEPIEEGLEELNLITEDTIREGGVGGYYQKPKQMVKGQYPIQVKKQYFGEY
jgi:hypothetical protein